MCDEAGGAFGPGDGRSHKLFLGERWGDKADENVEDWGHQYPATVLLAMVEELGEMAHALLGQTEIGDISSEDARRGRNLLCDAAGVGLRTRAYLEETFGADPSVDGRDIAGKMGSYARVVEENDDLAALAWQFHWSVEKFEMPTGDIVVDEAYGASDGVRWHYVDIDKLFSDRRKTSSSLKSVGGGGSVGSGTVEDAIGLLDYAEEFGDWGAAMEARRVLKSEVSGDVE